MTEEVDDEAAALERADRLIREGVIGDRGQIASIILEAVWAERRRWESVDTIRNRSKL